MQVQRPFTYHEFTSAPGALANENGAWLVDRSWVDDVNCESAKKSYCEDTTYCLACWVFPSSSQPVYTVSFFTKIAFDLSDYGGSSALSYEWQFNPWWGSEKATVGSGLEMKSSVGDRVYSDTLNVGDWSALYNNGGGWTYGPFKHTDSATFPTNSDKTLGYIPLAINITFPNEGKEHINYFVKSISLKITTPAVPSATPNPITEPHSAQVSIGALIGSIIGTAVFVTILILGFLFFWMRKKKNNYDPVDPAIPEANITPFNINTMREAGSEAGLRGNHRPSVAYTLFTGDQPPAYEETSTSQSETQHIQPLVGSSNSEVSSPSADNRHGTRTDERIPFSKR